MSSMSPRERSLRLFRHRPVDRMPLTLDTGGGAGISGPYLRRFRELTGSDDPAAFFDYDIRTVSAPLIAQAADFTGYHGELPPGTELDEFGVGRVSSDTFPLGHVLSPWRGFTSPREMRDYPFPLFELQPETCAAVRALHDAGYAVSAACGSINEWCYYLRGMEAFMTDLVDRPDMAEVLLDRVTDLAAQMGAGMAEAGVDIACFYGDVGGQHGLLISPRMWRRWIKPRWQRIFAAVRQANPDTLIFFHSCGCIEPIIRDLIEIGLHILNPIQPEAMDPLAVKRMYGDRLALWGGIGLQTTMTRAAADVRRDVRALLRAWLPGSGALVTTSNSLPLDIPWENVLALVETLRETGG